MSNCRAYYVMLATLIASTIAIVVPTYSMVHVKPSAVSSALFSWQGLEYLNKIALKPDKLLVHDQLLQRDIVSFIHRAALWNNQVCTYKRSDRLIVNQFNITVKHMAPLVAHLSNTHRALEATTLFNKLENILNFCRGACSEIKSYVIEELTSSPFKVALAFIPCIVTIPVTIMTTICSIYQKPGELSSQYGAMINHIAQGNYQKAGQCAAQLGITAYESRCILKCTKGLFGTFKNSEQIKTFITSQVAKYAHFAQNKRPIARTMQEFFQLDFGKAIKDKLQKTRHEFQGRSIYEVIEDICHPILKKGDLLYLDNLHKDHIEVFSARGTSKAVLNLDGSVNSKLSDKIGSTRRIKL